jgi:hypothetical protein
MLGESTKENPEKNTDEKTNKKKREADQLFNMAEKPVMEFISSFLEEPINILFKDDLPEYVEPLILLPLAEYKKNICLKFTLQSIPRGESRQSQKTFIDSIIHHPKVKEGVGFLLYGVKEVYRTLTTTMINNKLLVNTEMDLDENNWVLYSKYADPLTVKKVFLEETLSRLMYIKQNIDKFPPEMVEQINMEFPRVIEQLKIVNTALTPEIISAEKAINDTYADKPVIGIFIEEMNESDLPKPKLPDFPKREIKQTEPDNSQSVESLPSDSSNTAVTVNETASENGAKNIEYNIEEKTSELFI